MAAQESYAAHLKTNSESFL
jgi:hypothetical protein